MFIRCIYTFFYPPEEGYPDLDINPMIVSQFPLLLAGYALTACVFSCFIYRAVDMDSVIQMKWSAGCFAVFQSIVILNHFIFTVMFVDILSKSWQALMVGLLVGNFLVTITYLCVLFLYGKKLHYNKFKRPKQYRNSFHRNDSRTSSVILENNANTVLTLRKEPNNSPRPQQTQQRNVNLLESHVAVSSVATETSPEEPTFPHTTPPTSIIIAVPSTTIQHTTPQHSVITVTANTPDIPEETPPPVEEEERL
jgi:hypothetical protein